MKPWQIVFRKEFFEVFRDSRTLFNIIISPLLITPLILAVIGGMARRQVQDAQKAVVPVAAVGLDKAPRVAALFENATDDNLKVTEMTRADAEQAIAQRKVRAAFVVPENADKLLDEMTPVPVTLLLDQGSQSSQEAAERLKLVLNQKGQQLAVVRLSMRGLSPEVATPFTTTEKGIQGGASRGTLMLATFLPYIMALSAIMGGIYLANDSVAGEKERGTLETLLVTPASRRDLVLGKFLAVAAIALVSGSLSLIGLLWPFAIKLPAFSWMSESGLSLRPAAVAAMFLVQLPLAVLGAGLLLSISTFARNQKEAQSYLGPVILCASVAALLSMMIKAEAPLVWAFVPITNAALVLKQALEGVSNPAFVAAACAASVVYAAAAVAFATHLFQREAILLKA
jgi:ABC-type Na+ efflux pump, permease component